VINGSLCHKIQAVMPVTIADILAKSKCDIDAHAVIVNPESIHSQL
jgi:hypothetical protein